MLIRPPRPHSRPKYYFNDVLVLCIRNGARGCLCNVDKTVTQRHGDRPFAKREAVPARRGKAGRAFPSRRCGSLRREGSGKKMTNSFAKLKRKKKTKRQQPKTTSGDSQRSESSFGSPIGPAACAFSAFP